VLLEEIPFSKGKEFLPSRLATDNKLYVGCRKEGSDMKDFTNAEIDELAFWIHYLPDENLEWFTGAISESHSAFYL